MPEPTVPAVCVHQYDDGTSWEHPSDGTLPCDRQKPVQDVSAIPGDVLDGLRDTYTDEGCLIWWASRNSNLDGRAPREAWLDPSSRQLVRDAVDRLAGGSRGD